MRKTDKRAQIQNTYNSYDSLRKTGNTIKKRGGHETSQKGIFK